MTKVQLTQELVKYLFDYREDGFLIWKNPPSPSKAKIGAIAGYVATDLEGYKRRKISIKSKNRFAHRLIFLWHHGYLPQCVDHENNNTLDDRIENLRAATGLQNSKNRSSVKGSTSKYLGVSLNKKQGWVASIRHQWKKIFVGYFKTEQEAALAYNREAVRYHKEFANLNIIHP